MITVSAHGQKQVIVLSLRSSFYAMRILPDGQVVHLGSGPAAGPLGISGVEQYTDPNYVWDEGCRQYEYPTYGDTAYHRVALKVRFPKALGAAATDDATILPVSDLRLRYQRHEIRTDAQPALVPQHNQPARKASVKRETLVLHLQDIAYDFHVRLFYRLTEEHDVIERWVEVENKTGDAVDVAQMDFAAVHFPPGQYELTRAAGSWAREFIPVRQALLQGETVLAQRGLNTGHAVNPFYLVAEQGRAIEEAGPVYFGALAFSGNWALTFDVMLTDATRVFGGYEPTEFGMVLQPGEVHRTPAFVLGFSGEGHGGASRRLHSFARDYVLPGYKEGACRPVLYNSWEATYFKLSLEGQTKLARAAAAMGVELFCMDDGWFGGRRDDHAGLGDWVVSPDIFPTGLKPLIDEVKALGMRFGLWVEPEMVNPNSDLFRAHPDWVLHYPGRPRTEMRFQQLLDFGRPEVVEHLFNQLDTLLRTYEISFFKWDMNRVATEPGSVAGRGIWRAHVAGLYAIMDRLRKAHPGLEIQSCSGGGGRVDLGIMGRTDQVWASDNTDAFDRTFIEDGFSLAYPPRVMESWVTHEKNHQTTRIIPLDVRFDVAMRGALGIGTNIDKLTEEELGAYKRKIAFYKKIRPIVQNGDLYRLATTYEGKMQSSAAVSVWQTVTADRARSVYSIVVLYQLAGHYVPTYRLRGLEAAAVYRVTDEQEKELGRYSGGQLMGLGMPGDQRFGGAGCAMRSRTLLLERI